MPLTQQRLIDAVEAAQDYQHAFAELVRRVSLAHDELPDNLRLAGLSRLSAEDLLQNPHKSSNTITAEIERIRFTRRANMRRSEKRRLSQQPEEEPTTEDQIIPDFAEFTKP